MSNTRHLRQINPGSGQLARPKRAWHQRPPRSAEKRHLWQRAILAMQGKSDLEIPDHLNPDVDPAKLQEYPEFGGLRLLPSTAARVKKSIVAAETLEVLAWAESAGVEVTPWQLEVLEHFYCPRELETASG